jgi:hypothetical protein
MADFLKSEPGDHQNAVKKEGILSYKSKDIAQHITQLEHKMFQSISRTEFYGKGWLKATKETNSPNITNMIKRSSEVPTVEYYIRLFTFHYR